MVTIAVQNLHIVFHSCLHTGPSNDENHRSHCTQTNSLDLEPKTTAENSATTVDKTIYTNTI